MSGFDFDNRFFLIYRNWQPPGTLIPIASQRASALFSLYVGLFLSLNFFVGLLTHLCTLDWAWTWKISRETCTWTSLSWLSSSCRLPCWHGTVFKGKENICNIRTKRNIMIILEWLSCLCLFTDSLFFCCRSRLLTLSCHYGHRQTYQNSQAKNLGKKRRKTSQNPIKIRICPKITLLSWKIPLLYDEYCFDLFSGLAAVFRIVHSCWLVEWPACWC